VIATYEQRLDSDLRWALDEGSRHFDRQNSVHRTLRCVATALAARGIAFAVCGGMALFFHGYRRFTEDIDLLISRAGFDRINEHLDDLGLVRLPHGGRHPRDAETGVRVELLVTGEFPGDRKPKPVAFPDPAPVAIELAGLPCLRLTVLIELKLAAGLSDPRRLKDLADVQELIRVLRLPHEIADELNPWVREMYDELWDGVRRGTALE